MKKLKRKVDTEVIDHAEIDNANADIPSSVEVEVDNIPTEDDNIEILTKQNEYSLTMYLDSNPDIKYFIRFIQATERIIRRNDDYNSYIEFLRKEKRLNKCVFYPNITSDKACIELHHCISTLFEICITVCRKLMNDKKAISTFILADEVIQLHFQNKIALVPVSTTVHEILHLKQKLIPKQFIYGNYLAFYSEYKDFMDDKEKEKYELVMKMNHIDDIPYLLNHIEEE